MALAVLGAGVDLDVLCHHEGGIEAHAELTDHVHIGRGLALLALIHGLLEGECAALRYGAQILLQLLLRHAAAVVRDGQGPGGFAGGQPNEVIASVHALAAVLHGGVVPFINGVARIADQLPQKNLLMGIDGMNHHVQQPLGLRLELFLSHIFHLKYLSF